MSTLADPRRDAMLTAVEPLEAAILDHQDHLLEMMASGTAPDAILSGLAERLESLMPGGRCSILLVSDDGVSLRHGAAPHLPGAYCRAIDGIPIAHDIGSCGSAAYLGELVVVRDVRIDPRWSDFRQIAAEHGLLACWSSPVQSPDGTVLGTFAVYHAEPHEPTDREIALLQRFSGLAAVAIRHAAMMSEVRAAEAARAAADERSRAMGQLLSAISHELRTPMSSIVGFSELLRTVALTPERREQAVAHLTEAAQHMLGLVEDLLDLAKLDTGVVEPRRAALDVRTVLAEAVAVLEPLADEHRVRVAPAPEDPTPAVALADRRRLRQALINLIGNAIKFNRPGGSVATELAVVGDRIQLCIHDTGPGLPRSRDGLFEPFHRLGAERSGVPGTGLGLTISKQFIEAMGGRLQIDDRADGERGTTVLVSLVAAAGTAGAQLRQ